MCIIGSFLTERIVRKRSRFGEKSSHFGHAEFGGLVRHPWTDGQQVAGIIRQVSENVTGNKFGGIIFLKAIKEVNVNVAAKRGKSRERRKGDG